MKNKEKGTKNFEFSKGAKLVLALIVFILCASAPLGFALFTLLKATGG